MGRLVPRAPGANFSGDPEDFDAKLASLYLKLAPDRRVLLEAWGGRADAPPTRTSIISYV